MNEILRFFVILITLASLGFNANAQTIRYVKEGGAGAKDGSSWANVSGNLQATINASVNGQQVWVAIGTYTGQISLKNGVKVYGGFDPSHGLITLTNRVLPSATNTAAGSSILTNSGYVVYNHITLT